MIVWNYPMHAFLACIVSLLFNCCLLCTKCFLWKIGTFVFITFHLYFLYMSTRDEPIWKIDIFETSREGLFSELLWAKMTQFFCHPNRVKTLAFTTYASQVRPDEPIREAVFCRYLFCTLLSQYVWVSLSSIYFGLAQDTLKSPIKPALFLFSFKTYRCNGSNKFEEEWFCWPARVESGRFVIGNNRSRAEPVGIRYSYATMLENGQCYMMV